MVKETLNRPSIKKNLNTVQIRGGQIFSSTCHILKNQGPQVQVTFLPQIQVPNTEKGTPRAGQNLQAGRILPTGCKLPTPGQDIRAKGSKQRCVR